MVVGGGGGMDVDVVDAGVIHAMVTGIPNTQAIRMLVVVIADSERILKTVMECTFVIYGWHNNSRMSDGVRSSHSNGNLGETDINESDTDKASDELP
jgi:hypothetical protein